MKISAVSLLIYGTITSPNPVENMWIPEEICIIDPVQKPAESLSRTGG